MALNVNQEEAPLWFAEPPPRFGDQAEVLVWASAMFEALGAFLRRPEFPGVVFTRLDSSNWDEFKPQNGMMVYAGAGTLGPQEGFYVRESGVWRKIAGT